MTTSILSKIIHTKKLLDGLGDDEVKKFQKKFKCLLNCQTDGEFLGTILVLIFRRVNQDTIVALKDLAIQLSENKKKKKNDKKSSSQTQVPSISLSDLSSNTIDYLGSFLTTKERNCFGLLNRQLFIETQKSSFLLTSHNEFLLEIDEYSVCDRNFGFMGLYPTQISLFLSPFSANTARLDKSNLTRFESLFTCVHTIKCLHCSWLPFIPIDILFNMKNKKGKEIEKFCLEISNPLCDIEMEMLTNNLMQFSKNYQNYWQNKCYKKNKNIRAIDRLILAPKQSVERINDRMINVEAFLLSLESNYRKLEILNHIKLEITSLNALQSIFHPNLENIKLSLLSDVTIDVEKIKKDISINGNINSKKDINCYNCASLEYLELQTDIEINTKDCCAASINLLTGMDAFGLRKGLKHIVIRDKQPSWSPVEGGNTFVELMNKFVRIPYDDDDGSELMKRKQLTIIIEDFVGNLTLLDEYIRFLSENKDQINLLGIFETITIELNFCVLKHPPPTDGVLIFGQTVRQIEMRLQRMQVFDANNREVVIKEFDFDRNLVDQLVVDIIDWAQRVKDKQMEMKKEDSSYDVRFDCKVVFQL